MGNARDVALTVLKRVDQDNAFAAAALAKELPELKEQRESALAFELVHGVLRQRPWLDHLLCSVSEKGLKKIDPDVRRILRLGAYQIIFLSRVPAAAAVSDAVRMVKQSRAARLSGLTNALLRRISQMPEEKRHPGRHTPGRSLSDIARRAGQPEWIMKRFIDAFGTDEALAITAGFNAPSRRTLRINANRMSVEEAVRQLGEKGTPTSLSPWAVDVSNANAAYRLLEQGAASYQDEAAQLAVLALDPKPGERILDACAGRGGKTAAIAMNTNNKATVVATDKTGSKLDRLAFELDRQHLSAETVVQDLTKGRGAIEGVFNRVLLDAPCSGTGTLGRRPEIRWRLEESAVSSLVAVQQKLLDTAATLVADGGVLLYVVCSILPEEGIGQAERFLSAHPDFDMQSAPTTDRWPEAVPWNNGRIRINPAETRTDGYQFLVFVKNGKNNGALSD